MTKDTKRPEAYIREVTEGTVTYVQELHKEITSLRERIAHLEGDRARLTEEVETLRASRTMDAALEEQYAFIEQQNANLANLYVASYRLHETLSRREVLAIIQEIIANLVGSEEIGVFELDRSGDVLRLAWSFGLDEARYRTVPARAGIIGRSLSRGEIFTTDGAVADEALAHEEGLTACIPLTVEGKVTGAITVFRLLGHKPALTRVDQEIFELLATHAAMALYCTSLHARALSEGVAVAVAGC
jgi:hypothetical protein